VLASFLVLVVLDESKLPKAALSEKLDLLFKESSPLREVLGRSWLASVLLT